MRKISRRRYEADLTLDPGPPRDIPAQPPVAPEVPAPRRRRRISLFWTTFSLLVIAFFGALGAFLSMLNVYLENLPHLERLERFRPKHLSKIHAVDGSLLAEMYDVTEGRRELISLNEVSPILVKAVLASEDARFHDHPGVDIYRIVGAMYYNLRSGNLTGQGASTITMQIPRNLNLIPRDREWKRKVLEALLALQIERMYSKDEILEIYLNQVFLGHNRYGVEESSRFYFGRSARDVDMAQAALLVAMLKRPSHDDPYRHPERALPRRDATLRRLAEVGWASQADVDLAITTPLGLRERGAPMHPQEEKGSVERGEAPYFVEHVKNWLRDYAAAQLGSQPRYDNVPPPAMPVSWEQIYSQGYSIRTTVDPVLQGLARTSLQEQIRALEQVRRKHPSTWGSERSTRARPLEHGEVYDAKILEVSGEEVRVTLTGVSGRHGGRRATIVVEPGRTWLDAFEVLQPDYYIRVRAYEEEDDWRFVREPEAHLQGSLIAVEVETGRIVALVGGYDFHEQSSGGRWFNRATQALRQPGSAFKPIYYAAAVEQGLTPNSKLRDEEMTFRYGNQVYSPQNFTQRFHGVVSMRESLAQSYNLASIYLYMNLGTQAGRYRVVQDISERLGISTIRDTGLSLALGAAEVYPLELLGAYACFANNGMYIEPFGVEEITDPNGLVVYRHQPRRRLAVTPGVAAAMTDMLHAAVQEGTGKRAADVDAPLAGKTGTTNWCTDAWFFGYSSGLAVGVYIGFDLKQSMGRRFTGGSAALPAWIAFMESVMERHPEWFGPFRPLEQTVKVWVCRESGERASPMCRRVEEMEFTLGMQPAGGCGMHQPSAAAARDVAPARHSASWLAGERGAFRLPMPQAVMWQMEFERATGQDLEPVLLPPVQAGPRAGTIKRLPG